MQRDDEDDEARTTRVKMNTTQRRGRRQRHEGSSQCDGGDGDGTRSVVKRPESEGETDFDGKDESKEDEGGCEGVR